MYRGSNDWFWVHWFQAECGLGVHFLKWTWTIKPRFRPWPVVGFERGRYGPGVFRVYLLFLWLFFELAIVYVRWPWEKQ